MITITDEQVIIPRETWDRMRNELYFEELIENLMDSEDLLDAMKNDNDFIDIREYDRNRERREN